MNRDDDFFRLPKPRNPLRRTPDAGTKQSDARSTPKTSSRDSAQSPVPPELVKGRPRRAASAQAENPSEPPPPGPPASTRKRWWLWPTFGLGALGLIIVGGMIGYWAFMNIAARLALTDQPVRIRLPETANITMRTTNNIDVLMKGVITAQVPLQQTLDLPVKGTYDTIVTLDTKVPLETTIVYEGVIPIDTIADIEAKAPVNFQNVKKYKNLHFKAKLPMKLNLPVKLVVPVKQDIPFRYRGPLKVTIDHVIRAPVGTTLKTALKVNQDFSLPILSTVRMRLQLPQHPVKATIVEADLGLDLSTLRLERKPEQAPGNAAAAAP